MAEVAKDAVRVTGWTRAVSWSDEDNALQLIDQRKLPTEETTVLCSSLDAVFDAIRTMVVRGAPAIGAAAAYGFVIAARQAIDGGVPSMEALVQALTKDKAHLDEARPTAVNLEWATARMLSFTTSLSEAGVSVDGVLSLLLEEAHALAEQDVDVNQRMARFGAELVLPGSNILHHCNTGALATVDIGTALGVIFECHWQDKGIHVWVDETRPRLQGARLSAWELTRAGVPFHLIADSASGLLMKRGDVDVILFGADRVARNGDVANKIGSYNLSVLAARHGIPVYSVVPTSTIDLTIASGDDIEIEERAADEVACLFGTAVAPEGCPVFNPAFDVTPAELLTGIITEEGVCYPPYSVSLAKAKAAGEQRVKSSSAARLDAALAKLA